LLDQLLTPRVAIVAVYDIYITTWNEQYQLISSLLMFFITALFRFFNDEDFSQALITIMNESTAETHEKEN
jgi:cell shape-determining protein MreD